jgi:hypothetical protein
VAINVNDDFMSLEINGTVLATAWFSQPVAADGHGARTGWREEADVVRSLVDMADTLVKDYDVVDLLTGLADRCVHLLGVSAAG